MNPYASDVNKHRAVDYLNIWKRLYVVDGYLGWDPKWRVSTRIIW